MFQDFDIFAGTLGECEFEDVTKQWSNIELSSAQLELLDFQETIEVPDTITPNIQYIAVYPIPPNLNQSITFQIVSDSVTRTRLKAVFTDLDDVPIKNLELSIPSNGGGFIDLPDPDFAFGTVYRMYFQLIGGTESEVLYQGFGNLFKCNSETINDIEKDCF